MIRRSLRRVRDEDAGLSLAELLVSASLTLIILAMVGSFLISTAKITANSTQTTESTNDAANIANEITSVVRVATTRAVSGQALPDPAIVSGSSESLTIYSLSNANAANPAPSKITFSLVVDPDTLTRTVKETRCPATASSGFWVFGACPATGVRHLGGNLLPRTGVEDQLFTYYTASGQVIVLTPTSSATERAKVASVRVYVSVKATGAKTKQVVISNLVVLGNLGLDSSS